MGTRGLAPCGLCVQTRCRTRRRVTLAFCWCVSFDYVVAPLVDPNRDATRELAVDSFTRTDLLLVRLQGVCGCFFDSLFVDDLFFYINLPASRRTNGQVLSDAAKECVVFLFCMCVRCLVC